HVYSLFIRLNSTFTEKVWGCQFFLKFDSSICIGYTLNMKARAALALDPTSTLNTAPDRWHDAEIRRQMSGPAMRTFLNIAEVWRLSNEEQRALLGWPPESTYYKYKTGQVAALPYDMLMRISLVLGIYQALQVLYPQPG